MATGILNALKSNADVWNVLSSTLTVTVESSDTVVDKVNAKAKPGLKNAVVLSALAGEQSAEIRPIDLLRKIGTLTVPVRHSMAQLSASWAAIRYCWSIQPSPGKKMPFRLSSDARSMDFHQKTLLSDEFGVGFAGIIVERLLKAPNWIDTSAVLAEKNPKKKLQGRLKTRRQPDYVMWGKGTPYFVVECKGCQSTSAQTITQLASGLAQVDSLDLTAGIRKVTKIVVATRMLRRSTTVLVVDPDDSDAEQVEGPIKRDEKRNKWVIENDASFADLIWLGHEAQLLRFIGQYSEANKRTLHLPARPDLKSEFIRPDEAITERTINGSTFLGYSSPVLPELGKNWPRLFRGIGAHLLEALKSGKSADEVQDLVEVAVPDAQKGQPNISIGTDGTCYVLEFE